MQFNTIKNLGLAILTLLLLGVVVVGVYFNSLTMSKLDTVIEDNAPLQEQIFSINRSLESATKEFYAFIRAKKVYREDVLVPINHLHQALVALNAADTAAHDALKQRLVDSFQEVIIFKAQGKEDEALAFEEQFIYELLDMTTAIDSHQHLSLAEKEHISQLVVAIEVAFVLFLEKQEADLVEVFSVLDSVEGQLSEVKKLLGDDSRRIEVLLSELSFTRMALKEYEEADDLGMTQLLSLTEREINVLDAWTHMRDAVAVFNMEVREEIIAFQRDIANSSQRSSQLLLIFGGIALFLALLVSFVIGKALSYRISRLAVGIRNMAEGDYDSRLNLQGSDDISFLANSFDDLSGQLKNKELALYEQAHFDSLTGLPNRRKFQVEVEIAIEHARRHDESFVLMFIDLDNFKRVNDSLGHGVGDALLSDVAAKLNQNIRVNDSLSVCRDAPESVGLFRLGGDEFVVLLQDLYRPRDAARIAERILSVLTEPSELQGYEIRVSASIGICVFPDDAEDAESLMRNADVAMYHAKDRGKNSYQFYSSSMNETAIRQLELEGRLRKAIERQDFELHYQTQLNADTQQVESLEALLRWNDEEYGYVSPAEFIPVAEASNLIIPLGDWVINTVCEQIRRWEIERDIDVKIAINVSSIQFNAPCFAENILEIVRKNAVSPASIILELTEGIIMENSDKNIQLLHQLRNMGFELSIDDFGTGYSSLSYLKLFPLNELKIDRSFVDAIPEDQDNWVICKTMIALANNLGLRVVAEGVSSQTQLDCLVQAGCDLLQGFYIGYPLPVEQLDYTRFKSKQRQVTLSL